MTVLLVIFMLLAFVGIDYLVRESSRRMRLKKERREREAILETSVRLEFNDEAKSLKRVEVPSPRARILAVDDEGVVLDSFRRILVLEGFSIDTVETGPEALSLVQRNDYDFVFTDLKMPGMDGVEVVKAVKHLRPDVDVVVITGYGTIETAVDTLQHGACEYVQKPFTADELGQFINKLLVKRQARQEALRQPAVRVVSPARAEGNTGDDYCVPGGAFFSSGHVWARIEPDGHVRVGLDDFAQRALGNLGEALLPAPGLTVAAGDSLFAFRKGDRTVHFKAPLGGKVVEANPVLNVDASKAAQSPYKDGWVCRLQPSDLAGELPSLRIGKPVVDWYTQEIQRLQEAKAGKGSEPLAWEAIQESFLG